MFDNRMPWWIALFAALLVAGGCAAQQATRPVSGSMEDGSEAFSGTSTVNGDHTGTLIIQSDKGLLCVGRWSYISQRIGRGVFNCNNGQGGPFEFNGVGASGSGAGRLGDRRFVFTYG